MKMTDLTKVGSIIVMDGYNQELRRSVATRAQSEEQKAKAEEEAKQRLEER